MMGYLYGFDVVTGEVRDSESKRNKVKTEAMATLKMKEGVVSQRTPCPSREEERQKPDLFWSRRKDHSSPDAELNPM